MSDASPGSRPCSIGVLTSGGDAPGMNAAVRAAIRAAAYHGVTSYAVHEGLKGLVYGGDLIKPADPADTGGILRRGGTVIGTARCKEFRTRDGRRSAARNMVDRGIDALVAIGGDGTLTGCDVFRSEWPELLAELVERGEISAESAASHPSLRLVGVVGSIDNDMYGTDMTIGADTALHRIVEAIDALRSTASSHQRTFVVEVMGRHCGYLALMSSLATAANWVFLPEQPPAENWAAEMCRDIKAGRDIGRRQSIVVVAEGACDLDGNPITSQTINDLLETELGEDARITILGHVQRGGSPSAFDRYLGTLMGAAAVEQLINEEPGTPAQLIGLRENRVLASPLVECVERTRAVAERIKERDFEGAMRLRGGSFHNSYRILRTIQQAAPKTNATVGRRPRVAIIHGGGPAPGMNSAARAFVRLTLDYGATPLAVRRGFRGLRRGDIQEMRWMDVSGWVSDGGAELGTNRYVPTDADMPMIAEQLAAHRVDALLVAGGWAAYQAAYALHSHRTKFKDLDIPIVCMPMTIANNVPGTELSVGSDTALNSIISDLDKIQQSAVATRRVFVVEVMGHDCGYLALMSGLSSGAERIYMPETGIRLDDLTADIRTMETNFRSGKRLGMVVRGEGADPVYTTEFLTALFEKEGGNLFDARAAVLGHVQEGGDPSPFDRIHATTLTAHCLKYLGEKLESGSRASAMLGIQSGHLQFTDLTSYPIMVEKDAERPVEQRWMQHLRLAEVMCG